MPRKIEPLDGGLVTDRDPAQLRPGQMSAMRNFVYRNGSTSLFPAAGRSIWGTVSATATAVRGLRDIQFDNGDHYLIAMAGNLYRRAKVQNAPSSFSDLATIASVGSAQSLEAVQYRNRFFLLNGATADSSAINTNVVVYLSATAANTPPSTRQHGLLPVDAAPSIVTGAGTFSQTVTGYYEYWTTEIAKVTQDGAEATLESAFSADSGPTTQLVSATGVVPTIQQPMIHNPLTSGWRIYRSPFKTKATDKKFPTGFMIAELSTAASAHADTTAFSSATSFPGSFNASAFYFGFASASSMASDNGVYASATVGGTPATIQQSSYGFSLGGFTGTVVGIAIEVQGYVSSGSAPVPVNVTIGKRSTQTGHFTQKNLAKIGDRPQFSDITASKSGLISSTNSAAPTTFTVGSSSDRWFPSNQPGLVDADFDTNFMVVLSVSKANVSVGFDYVKAYVYYGASNDSTVVFPTVVYSFGDITSQVAKNFPPPSASTGDSFQDSLVLNDVLNQSLVRYSFPGDPEAFPPTYFIDFETRDNDNVTHIRTVNNRLIVGLDHSVWRLNYLPSERDSTFDRGRAVELISRSFGIFNAMCACTLTIDGESELLAFVSHKGIHTTDGFNFITRSLNQTWRNFIPSIASTIYPIALLNDPENRVLRFFYRNDSDPDFPDESFLCLHLSYDRGDIGADGSFKFAGPVHMRNWDPGGGNFASLESVAAVPLNTGLTTFYLGYGGTDTAPGAGKVYRDGGSLTIPAEYSQSTFTTRRMFLAGLSGEWELDDMYAYCGAAGSPLATYTFLNAKTNKQELVSGPSKSFGGSALLHRVSPKLMCEGLRIVCVASGTNYSYEYLVVGSKSFGLEDSGV